MDGGGYEPGAESCGEYPGEGQFFFYADERCDVEDDCGYESPDGSFDEVLHCVGVAAVFDVDECEDECACEGHDSDESGGGGEFFRQGGCAEYYS